MISWINPKIIVKNTNKKGIGSFAKLPITKDEIIIVQGGRIMNYKNIMGSDYKDFCDHCFQIEEDFLICPVVPLREKLDGIFQVNHSCNPNCGVCGSIILVAMRNIKTGEEITFDYAMTDVQNHHVTCAEMKCICGEKNCRHIITGNDWKNKDLQKKYKGYFSVYVQKMIENN